MGWTRKVNPVNQRKIFETGLAKMKFIPKQNLLASALAPPNAAAALALIVSPLSVAVAIFLVLEKDRLFAGLVRLSSGPLQNTLNQVAP